VAYVGKLWVSAVRMRCNKRLIVRSAAACEGSLDCSTSVSKPLMALELSWKDIKELLGLSAGSVALTIWNSVCGCVTPSMVILPPKNQ
jgi:hypothetical protein